MVINFAKFKKLLADSYENWTSDRVPVLAAAFAFYAVLALSPLVLLSVVVGGEVLGQEAVRENVLQEVRRNIGAGAAEFIGGLIESTAESKAGVWATVFSVLIAFFSASNLFNQLSMSVRIMWGLHEKDEGFLDLLKHRLWAFVLMIIFMALFVGWVIFDAWLGWLAKNTPGFPGWSVLSFVISLVGLTLLFATTFRAMPRGYVAWRDVWFGAILTSVGFTILRTLLSIYFTYSTVAAAYGSAGALIVILLWIYYSSQLYFFGTEVVYTYAHNHGSQVSREHDEPPVPQDEETAREQQEEERNRQSA